MSDNTNCNIITTEECILSLLNKDFTIPRYQRHYQWTIKNVKELWSDILHIKDKADKENNFTYRLGTIILYKKVQENESFEIVDGQQRIITLYLLFSVLCKENNKNYQPIIYKACKLIGKVWSDDKLGDSRKNISENYKHFEQCKNVYLKEGADWLLELLENNIKVIVFEVSNDLDTAFQLFDSHNSRGKDLSPHDLLKAYHLREMSLDPLEKEYSKEISEKWDRLSSLSEKNGIINLHDFFNDYLFRIYLWAHRLDSRDFTKNDINIYKGASAVTSNEYAYIKKLKCAGLNYQLTDHCLSGRLFFEKVFYYHKMLTFLLLNECNNWLINNENLKGYIDWDTFKKVKNLYYVTLLLYFDKFSNLQCESVNAIFDWIAFLRIRDPLLRITHIDTYVNDREGLFQIILDANCHIDIANCSPEIKSKIKSEIKKIKDRAKNRKENEHCWKLRQELIILTVDNKYNWPKPGKEDEQSKK